MSQSMIEKVAKAIRLRDSTDEFALARAAIEAMKEPTEEMITSVCFPDSEYREEYKELYQNMINEALNETR